MKKCDSQLYSYIQTAIQNLIGIQNNLINFKKTYKHEKTIESAKEEYELEKIFILQFLLYIISMREDVLIIYPKYIKVDKGNFPPIIMKYSKTETLGDIHDRYSQIFFNPTIMSSFRGTFLNPSMKSLISYQEIESNEYV